MHNVHPTRLCSLAQISSAMSSWATCPRGGRLAGGLAWRTTAWQTWKEAQKAEERAGRQLGHAGPPRGVHLKWGGETEKGQRAMGLRALPPRSYGPTFHGSNPSRDSTEKGGWGCSSYPPSSSLYTHTHISLPSGEKPRLSARPNIRPLTQKGSVPAWPVQRRCRAMVVVVEEMLGCPASRSAGLARSPGGGGGGGGRRGGGAVRAGQPLIGRRCRAAPACPAPAPAPARAQSGLRSSPPSL